MTSAELIGLFKGKLKVGDTAIDVSPEDIYFAASLAQFDIMADAGVLDIVGRLALAANQKEYTFSALDITGATFATPIVVTIAGHPYHTGDKVTIFGALGNTAANGRWTITRVDANTFSLDGSVGNAAWTSGGKAYHDLMRTWEIKTLKFVSTPFGPILVKDYADIADHELDFAEATPGTARIEDVVEAYQVREEYTKLVFLNEPPEAAVLEFLATRIMLESEKVTATVNPIIPFHYDDVFIQGVRYHILDKMNDTTANLAARGMLPGRRGSLALSEKGEFERMVQRIHRRVNKRRFNRLQKDYKMIW